MRVKQRPAAADEAHSSVVGGSTAKLRRLCNASIDEERKVPKETAGYAADRGTALHHVVEVGVRENLSSKALLARFAGTVYEAPGMAHAIELPEKLLRAKALPALKFFDDTVHPEAEFWLEKKMPFPGIPEGKGTGDVVFDAYHVNGESGVIDYKFGDGVVVQANDNDQGRFYISCARALGLLPDRREYVFYIFQPAEKLTPDKYASRAVFTRKDIDDFEADLIDAVDQWRKGRAKHNVGPHCEFCKGRIACGPYTGMIAKAVASDVDGLSTDDLAHYLNMRKGIEQWCSDVYKAALRNAQNGFTVPGFGLEPAEGNRVFKDEAAALGALTRLGMPTDVRTTKAAISAPQALAWLKENGTPEAQIARFESMHVRRPNNGEKLVKGESTRTDNFGRLLRAMKTKLGVK